MHKLNPQQELAVINKTGKPALVIAGAGAGKTTVLTQRIAYLVKKGESIKRMLILTFTNKASSEMIERLEKIGIDTRNVYIGTFHSVFFRLVKRYYKHIGYRSSISILDAKDDRKALITVLKREGVLDRGDIDPKELLSRFSKANLGLLTLNEFESKISKLHKEYIKSLNAVNFDGIMELMEEALRNKLILLKLSSAFKHIFVDEFQDTNLSQFNILKKLSVVHKSIFCIGDDYQSIYKFRGSDLSITLGFKKQFQGANIFKLEKNYRSVTSIVELGAKIISKNTNQIEKKLESNKDNWCQHIRKKAYDNQYQESNDIVSQIERNGDYSNFAIIYRNNNLSIEFENVLKRKGIPYKVFGSKSIADKKEVKDLISYLKFLLNKEDEMSLERIINTPNRAIGKTLIEKIKVLAFEYNTTIYKIILNPAKYFSGKTLLKLQMFNDTLDKIDLNPKTVFHSIVKHTGYMKYAEKNTKKDAVGEVEYFLKMVSNLILVLEKRYKDVTLSVLMDNISLDSAEKEEDGGDYVSLMTIHKSKGLEFNTVFLVGLEEDTFPSARAESIEEMEEERRCFYVAVTRAKEFIQLSYNNKRTSYGRTEVKKPSKFLFEIK
jgi:DNA helicase-2/ATP-dependent DNA helicase PcrA